MSELFATESPRVLIHCGGICDVEKCENDPNWAWQINVHSLEPLLTHLPDDTRFVYVSSDHVFGGNRGPYTESSKPDPITVYGQTRVAAENIVSERRPDALIIRTGLAIGPSFDGRTGHLDWLRYRQMRGLPMTVVHDECRSTVWADALALRIRRMAEASIYGVRHIVSTRTVSRLELARYLNDHFNLGANLKIEARRDRNVPHLGRVELQSCFNDELANPLPSVVCYRELDIPQEGEKSATSHGTEVAIPQFE